MSLRFYKTDGNFVDICVCNYSNIKKDEWVYMSMKGTVPNGYDPNKIPALLLSLN